MLKGGSAKIRSIEPSLSLTEAGRVYVEACERIPEQVEEADRAAMAVHKEPKGRLCVTVNWQDVRISERGLPPFTTTQRH